MENTMEYMPADLSTALIDFHQSTRQMIRSASDDTTGQVDTFLAAYFAQVPTVSRSLEDLAAELDTAWSQIDDLWEAAEPTLDHTWTTVRRIHDAINGEHSPYRAEYWQTGGGCGVIAVRPREGNDHDRYLMITPDHGPFAYDHPEDYDQPEKKWLITINPTDSELEDRQEWWGVDGTHEGTPVIPGDEIHLAIAQAFTVELQGYDQALAAAYEGKV